MQGYHLNKDQCTLDPVVISCKNQQNHLVHTSICILSDDLDHDTSFVHELQRFVRNYIQDTLPQIKHTAFWSNDCAGQYKNFKNLMNLCNYVIDFRFDAIWSFFATSHGRSPCDGIEEQWWGRQHKKFEKTYNKSNPDLQSSGRVL